MQSKFPQNGMHTPSLLFINAYMNPLVYFDPTFYSAAKSAGLKN